MVLLGLCGVFEHRSCHETCGLCLDVPLSMLAYYNIVERYAVTTLCKNNQGPITTHFSNCFRSQRETARQIILTLTLAM